ncbi:MAG: DUF4337 domain-containing protein [Bacteroidia bacterium]
MSESTNHLETRLGLFLAIFAAILAISDLFAGKYGDDEIIAHNEQTKAYNWFQSKSIKQGMSEGHLSVLTSMKLGGMVQPDRATKVDSLITLSKQEIGRYKKEKTEILEGSAKVGKENWVQEKEGKLGQITGANEWGEKADKLGAAGDMFDYAGLFLQLCLVMGAVGLITQSEKQKKMFFMMLLGFGLAGTIFTVIAYKMAMVV